MMSLQYYMLAGEKELTNSVGILFVVETPSYRRICDDRARSAYKKKRLPGDANFFVIVAPRSLRGQKIAQTRLDKPASWGLLVTIGMRGKNMNKVDTR